MFKTRIILFLLPVFAFAISGFSLLSTKQVIDIPPAKEELGKKLFFDKILSSDYSLSCASCHKPEFAFADTLAFSNGISGNKTTRNVPSVMNVLSRSSFFWDGRAKTLEEQVIFPIENPQEMNLKISAALKRLSVKMFLKAL